MFMCVYVRDCIVFTSLLIPLDDNDVLGDVVMRLSFQLPDDDVVSSENYAKQKIQKRKKKTIFFKRNKSI